MKDDYTLQKVSKRYSKSQSIKNWELASPEITDAIEKVLIMNKTKVLQSLPNNQKTIQKANIELTSFIHQFIKRLTPHDDDLSDEEKAENEEDEVNNDKLRLPKNLSSNDFDYDFQLKKHHFLENLLSNELKLVDNLKDAKIKGNKENAMWKRYAREYEKMYNKEVAKLDEQANEISAPHLNYNQGNMLNIELYASTGSDNDIEEEDVLDKLESHLTKLRSHTDHLTTLSSKLDDLNALLEE